MTKLQISNLIDKAEEYIDSKLHVGSHCLWINIGELQDALSKIRAILPEEIKTAEMILKRRDDIYIEAQNRADKIINEAQTKAADILSENELIKAVREKAAEIQQQVKNSCEEMKNKASEEAALLRQNAFQEAQQTKDGAKTFASELLIKLEQDVEKVHQHIKDCQAYLSSLKEGAEPDKESQNVSKKKRLGGQPKEDKSSQQISEKQQIK